MALKGLPRPAGQAPSSKPKRAGREAPHNRRQAHPGALSRRMYAMVSGLARCAPLAVRTYTAKATV